MVLCPSTVAVGGDALHQLGHFCSCFVSIHISCELVFAFDCVSLHPPPILVSLTALDEGSYVLHHKISCEPVDPRIQTATHEILWRSGGIFVPAHTMTNVLYDFIASSYPWRNTKNLKLYRGDDISVLRLSFRSRCRHNPIDRHCLGSGGSE